jgi:hypothetical protein
MPRLLTRPVKLALFGVMAVCLPLTMAGEALALAYNGGAVGNEAGTTADVFGWLFAAAFLAVFLLAIYEQDRRLRLSRRAAALR